MHINLSEEMKGFIKRKVADGFYGNATELICDAISRLQATDVRAAAWQFAIKQGDEQLDRGEGIIYTVEVMKDIAESAINAKRIGLPIITPDVLP